MPQIFVNPRPVYMGSSQVIAINLADCKTTVYVPASAMNGFAKTLTEPDYEATKHGWAPIKAHPENMPYNPYHGRLYDGTATHPPDPRVDTLSGGRRRTWRSYKAWKAAQLDGNILVSPTLVYAATAVVFPGAKRSGKAVVVKQRRSQTNNPALKRAKSCGSWNGIIDGPGHPAPGFNIQGAGYPAPGSLANVYCELDMYQVSADPWVMPTPAEADALWLHVVDAVQKVGIDYSVVNLGMARANNTGFDLLTNLGELKKTLTFIFSNLKNLILLTRNFQRYIDEVVKRYKKAKREGQSKEMLAREAAKKADEIASIWMQYRYALMPLLYAIRDGLAALEQGGREYITSRAKVSAEVEIEPVGPWSFTPLIIDKRCYVKRQYDTSLPLKRLQGLITNIPQTAWELTKFSWMIDWAFNIGDTLSSLQAPPGVKREVVTYSNHVPKGTIVIATNADTGERVEIIAGFYHRQLVQPNALLGLTMNFRFNWKRAVDSVAVIWQQFRSSHRR